MIVEPIKTKLIHPGEISLTDLIDKSVSSIPEGSVLAITSKIVSICNSEVVPVDDVDKEELVKQCADYYLPSDISEYGYHFTITNNTLISMAGIDESNGDNIYILWPKQPQKTANYIREHLSVKFGLTNVGVVITDSTCTPMRAGTSGIAIAHSGFDAVNDYIGKPDLFGRPFQVSQLNVAGGLASAAVLAMGEGTEQTPLCVIKDVKFVSFQDRNPSREELEGVVMDKDRDLFAPFLSSADWLKGEHDRQ